MAGIETQAMVASGITVRYHCGLMRMDFETAQRRYAEISHAQQANPCPWGRSYDFYRLLDGTFNVKSMNVVFAEKNLSIGKTVKGDLFRFVVICSRHIEEHIKLQERGNNFLDCWVLFRAIIEALYTKGEVLSNELVISSGRLLFIAALIFNLPDNCNLENIVSNPNARKIPGTFWAETQDIEFSKLLPCDLSGSFQTESDVLISLKTNLQFYLDKIER
jgi:hypothetical protein